MYDFMFIKLRFLMVVSGKNGKHTFFDNISLIYNNNNKILTRLETVKERLEQGLNQKPVTTILEQKHRNTGWNRNIGVVIEREMWEWGLEQKQMDRC